VKVLILAVPYDSGVRGVRMGRGPERLVERGLVARLAGHGHEVAVETIAIADSVPPLEAGAALQLNRLIADRVREAVASGAFPVVLAGNCNTAVGTIAGLAPDATGVAWFDSHGDLNTPETTGSGFFDGMALAMVTGRCWSKLSACIPGFRAVPDEHVVLAGARDLDPPERELLAASGIQLVTAAALKRVGGGELERAISALAGRVRRVYLHIDLDVLDREEARANQFAAAGGPTVDELALVVQLIGSRLPIAAVAVTAYDPSFDPEDRAAGAAIALLEVAVNVTPRAGLAD
jgi:arginase